MKISRRALIAVGLLSLSLLGVSSTFAQAYPAGKAVKIIVAASAGTTADTTARYLAEGMSRQFGVPFVVENRVGAGGIIAIDAVAKALPDGHTILMTGAPIFSLPYTTDAPVPFNPLKDFTPIGRYNGSALAFVVPADSPYKTLTDLIRGMKDQPGELAYASAGIGTTSHVCTVLLNHMTNTSAKHVSYKGAGPALVDTVSGQVPFTCGSVSVIPLVKSGKLRALAVTSSKRWEDLPEIPTVVEAGVPGYEISSWLGLMVPAQTPKPIVQRLSDLAVSIAKTPEFRAFSAKQGLFVEVVGHKEFLAEMPAEASKWKQRAQLTK